MITKLIVYGSAGGGKYSTALKLMQDNPYILSDPYEITDMKRMRHFLSSPTLYLGIITAPSVPYILNKCKGIRLPLVLFIADPTETLQAGEELVRELVWGGSSAAETLDRLHSPESISKAS